MATLQERVSSTEIERDEWRAKAKSLATNFMGALKDLKQSLHNVKRDQHAGMIEIRSEFDGRIRELSA